MTPVGPSLSGVWTSQDQIDAVVDGERIDEIEALGRRGVQPRLQLEAALVHHQASPVHPQHPVAYAHGRDVPSRRAVPYPAPAAPVSRSSPGSQASCADRSTAGRSRMYHSRPHTIEKTSSGMERKKLSSLIWLVWALMAWRLRSIHGTTSTD